MQNCALAPILAPRDDIANPLLTRFNNRYKLYRVIRSPWTFRTLAHVLPRQLSLEGEALCTLVRFP